MARSVPGRPTPMGEVTPGKMTVPRSGRTGRVFVSGMGTSGAIRRSTREPGAGARAAVRLVAFVTTIPRHVGAESLAAGGRARCEAS